MNEPTEGAAWELRVRIANEHVVDCDERLRRAIDELLTARTAALRSRSDEDQLWAAHDAWQRSHVPVLA